MFLRPVLVSLLTVVTVFCCAPVFAGKVELTTYYPAPFGEYKELNSTGNTHLAQESGANVGIGTSTPQNKLDVAGSAVIGTDYAGTNDAPENGLLVEGPVAIGTTAPQIYDSHPTALDVSGYAAADDIYLNKPVTGTPRWASQPAFGTPEEYGPVCVGKDDYCSNKGGTTITITNKSFCALSYEKIYVKKDGNFGSEDFTLCSVRKDAANNNWVLSAEHKGDPSMVCFAICF